MFLPFDKRRNHRYPYGHTGFKALVASASQKLLSDWINCPGSGSMGNLAMYDAMDSFLNTDTWCAGHPNDERHFYLALSKIVRHDDFNADKLNEYIRAKKGAPDRGDDSPLSAIIDSLSTRAGAVREYLLATRE